MMKNINIDLDEMGENSHFIEVLYKYVHHTKIGLQ